MQKACNLIFKSKNSSRTLMLIHNFYIKNTPIVYIIQRQISKKLKTKYHFKNNHYVYTYAKIKNENKRI